jgi:hypothetical protein
MSNAEIADLSADSPVVRPPDWDDVVMRLLASGIVQVFDSVRAGPSLRLPYPPALQRALNRISVMSMAAGVELPGSVMDLLRWAGRPFGEWPLWLRTEGMEGSEVLLAHGQPSRACVEWSLFAPDVEAEFREWTLVRDVLDTCRAHDRPDVYVAFRALLIERPAMSERDLALTLAQPGLSLLATQLRGAYRPAPGETVVGGYAVVCSGCGNLHVVQPDGQRTCLEWDCPDPASQGTRLAADEGVVWLGRELRMFVAAPGRAELRIARRLEADGIAMRRWPDYDACDLVPAQAALPADVKSWANPVRLARRLDTRPPRVPAGAKRFFVVIAREQTQGRPHYLRALRTHSRWLRQNSHVEAVTEDAYVRRVKRWIGGSGR